ncbi:MAG: hypothetical protein K2H52_13005 [Lachnospiraceae bacterium]|nr:hypothetical protein [Lachnospiraceae bacterium]
MNTYIMANISKGVLVEKKTRDFLERSSKDSRLCSKCFSIKMSKYDDVEKLLNDVTYETIYGMMELLDGHKNHDLRGKVINRITGNCINSNIELHNYCEEYLNCSDI